MPQANLHHLLTTALHHHQSNRLPEAEALYRQVLAADPQNLDALHLLGVLAINVHRYDAAIDLIQQAITIHPLAPSPHYNLGCALQNSNRAADAEKSFRRAIELKPDYADAHNNLGDILRERLAYPEAEQSFRRALAINPNLADAWTNLGVTLNRTKRQQEAIDCHHRALALRPDFPIAHNNLGNALMDCGQVPEAIAHFRRAAALQPNHAGIRSNLLLTLFYNPARDPAAHFREHQLWNEQFAAPLLPTILPHTNDPTPERALRIGYLSPDFYDHSVRFFFEPLLANHNPQQVKTFCYAHVFRSDHITARLQQLAHHWRDITTLSDDRAADLIREDRIDILVDLAGHTAGNRIRIFARKPAPIQVSYLGYLGSTGLTVIDYRFTDSVVDPPPQPGEADSLYTEKLFRLPDTFACFRPPEEAPPIAPAPFLANGFITFGCTNMLYKITPALLSAWATILSQLPTARLHLITKGLEDPIGQTRILDALAAKNIDKSRITLTGKLPLPDYLAAHAHIDILLDTFPINGHTVTCNALWMGVPLIPLAGKTYPERLGASVLSALNLTELIAHTPDDYVQIATTLATQPQRLEELRNTMRARMKASPLMDESRFANNVEAAYRAMWHRFTTGETTRVQGFKGTGSKGPENPVPLNP